MTLPWKTVWVVGGSSGLGAHTVQQLANAGAKVYVSARDRVNLHAFCAEHECTEALHLDVSDPEDCMRAVKYIFAQDAFLPDLIILNAAVYTPMSHENFNVDAIARMVQVNYMGVVHMIGALLPYRSIGKKTVIAAIGSPSGWRGLPGGIGYGPTKAALINLFESLKLELANTDFDLKLVNPGFIRTRLTDKNTFSMPQLMEPDEAAKRLIKGLMRRKFETAFPYPFILFLKFLRVLPYRLYFSLAGKLTGK